MTGREDTARPSLTTSSIPSYTTSELHVWIEIAVFERVPAGHLYLSRLVNYFATAHNLYLVFDVYSGGELFDRICSKGYYFSRCVGDELSQGI
jgi:hypothetical protein